MAVYTEVSDEELRAFLGAYDLGEVLTFKGIAEGVENSNFLLGTRSGNYVLTLYEKRVHREDLPFFLGLMEHLASRGIACPLPVKARDGAVLHDLRGRPAAVITFLEGLWPRRVHPFHCQELGAQLARLHLAGGDFALKRPNALSVGSWRPLYESCDGRADQVCEGLAAGLERELDRLEAEWPAGLPEGVIHADLFPDNVFFRDEKLTGLIDFYFACNDCFAYDLAICMNAWCFEPDGAFNATKARHLLNSYRGQRPVGPEELAALPILARGAAMRFLLTRLYDWLNCPAGALVTPKDPLEYWHKLRFHQGVRGPGAYGLT
ncbi:homoserine kinase [Tistlia consotensis]|uniref:Homoserine kinase n=1 Tax=Tistlia consotensis USBA 355 TaxID=560819 RepID=A0A1Y6B8T9_9PROT|nr:homoserine kinase [Tistlia consotensis]SME94516.1 homoserine kinase [Tistlia consotensis USBA 355]SNR29387.1 homoserine kinase [Tistlia consotensis]